MQSFYNPPLILKKLFGSFVWETSCGKILLTFDDGPIPETTPVILKQLRAKKIKALFFAVGDNIKKYPSLCNQILSEGHVIGNHTYHHKRITKISYDEAIKEIRSFNELLYEKHNYRVKYFRPPHGIFNHRTPSLLRQFGLTNVLWSLLTYDYKNDMSIVKFAVQKYLKQNSIIVLHDSLKSKDIIVDAIDLAVSEADKKGFKFGEPVECLK